MSGKGEVSEVCEPVKKRPRLSLSKKKKKESNGEDDESLLNRFTFRISPEVNRYKTKSVPKNTQKSTQWALKIFDDWVEARRQTSKECPPKGILSTQSAQLLCTWLCRFFTEVRKSDGNPYCPRSLSSIFAGLQRHIEVTSECEGSIHLTGPEFIHTYICFLSIYSITGTVPNAMPSTYESTSSTALDSSIKENVDPANLEKVKDTFKQLNFQSMQDCTFNFTFSFSK